MHKSFDHKKFAEIMRNCKHKWLITYDDSEYIRELFSFANIIPWDLTYGMRNVTKGSNQKGKELFISNYLKQLPRKQQMTLFEPKVKYVAKKESYHISSPSKKRNIHKSKRNGF